MDQKQFKSFLRFAPKGKSLRWVARVPLAAATIHPEVKKYLDPLQDQHEMRKDQDLLLSKFPEFDLREKNNNKIVVNGFLDAR